MEEDFPDMFRKTILYMIWKAIGPQEIMKNSRFIHMKEHYLPRTVESIVVNVMKDDILECTKWEVNLGTVFNQKFEGSLCLLKRR